MKKHLLSLIVLAVLTIFACKEAATSETTEMAEDTAAVEDTKAPDYAKFDKNNAVLTAFVKAHCDENADALGDILSDTLHWSPPMYNGNKWLGKEDLMTALQSYHADYDNIKYTPGITLPNNTGSGVYSGSVYPKEAAANDANAIRQYGTWTATHIASGKEIGVKWFGVASINDAGKIAMWTEYWDVHGLAAQIADE